MSALSSVAAAAELIRTNLAHFERQPVTPSAGVRRAAVTICVLDAATGPEFLLLRRSTLGRNPGQWALPGGRTESDETHAKPRCVSSTKRPASEHTPTACSAH